MKGRTFVALAALGTAAAGAIALYKKKKIEQEQMVLEFDLTQDDAEDAAAAVEAAENAEAYAPVTPDSEDSAEDKSVEDESEEADEEPSAE